MDGSNILSVSWAGKKSLSLSSSLFHYSLKRKKVVQLLNVIYYCCFNFQTDPQKASFHLPLHRYFSVFLRQAVKYQGFTLKELLPEPFMLSLLMMHPLRIQVGKFKITFMTAIPKHSQQNLSFSFFNLFIVMIHKNLITN